MRKIINNIIIIVLIGVILFIGYLIYKELKPVFDAMRNQNTMIDLAVKDSDNPYNRKIDFNKLWEKNEDVVGWLYIPDTSVDYPILMGDTDDEYLYRDIYGNWSGLGSIFALTNDSRKLDNARSVIFGHNMMYYEMFGELKRYYKDDDFRNEHDTFYVYTPESVMELKIFSIFGCHEEDSIISNYKEIDGEGYNKVVGDIYNKNEYLDVSNNKTIEDYYDKKIYSLVTCKGEAGTDYRLLVNGVVVREKPVDSSQKLP